MSEKPPWIHSSLTVEELEASLVILLSGRCILDWMEQNGWQAWSSVFLLPFLASNARVNPAHPVVVHPVRRLCSIVPRVALESSLSTPAHRASISTRLALGTGVEP